MNGEPQKPLTETQAAFARRRGVAKSAVAKWKARGLLSMTADGLVEIEESEWRLDGRPGTYRGGKTKAQRAVEAAGRATAVPVEVATGETPAAAAERIVMATGAPYDHAEAVRIKENYLALLRQMEFDVKSGAVVPIPVVVAAVVEQYARVRNKMLGMATRVAPRAAVLKSAEQVRALIEEEVSLALRELTLDGDGRIGVDELRERLGTVH